MFASRTWDCGKRRALRGGRRGGKGQRSLTMPEGLGKGGRGGLGKGGDSEAWRTGRGLSQVLG